MLFPVLCFGQGVKVSLYDNFIKKHRIELEPVLLHSATNGKLSVTFSSAASDLFLQVSGTEWGAATINDGDAMIFLFTNDSTVTVKSTGLQSFESGLNKNTYKHQYALSIDHLKAFSEFELAAVRKYSFTDFFDLQIQKSFRSKLQKSCELFLEELKKAKVVKTLKTVDVKDLASHVGDSVSFCSKVYHSRFFESSENKPTVLNLQSNFDDPLVNVVIMDEHRKNFPEALEKIYLNKDVCVSGVVTLRNNIPYVHVRSRDQIKVRGKATLEDIALFVGDSVTVSGTIFSAKYFAESATSPTLLNMGAPFPDQPLTVVIEKADRSFFESNPEVFYLNKEVSVSGKVVLYKNKPQIVVREREQLTVLNDNAILRANSVMRYSSSGPAPVPASNSARQPIASDGEVETQPEFPGGLNAFIGFLQKNLQVPTLLEGGANKTVLAGFDVSQEGQVRNITILTSAGDEYDKEVLRVLNLMPRWKPKQRGRLLMDGYVKQPITFRYEGVAF